MPKNKIDNSQVDIDRKEDKYIIKKNDLPAILAAVIAHLEPAFPQEHTAYTLINSVYFDSKDLDFVKQHLDKVDPRKKLRIRTYGPNGDWEHTHWLEDKYKTGGKSYKQRVQVNDPKASNIFDNKYLNYDQDLEQLNNDLTPDELKKKTDLLNYIMLAYKVQPICSITYKRMAFEKGSLRVTIDQELKVKPIKMFDIDEVKLWRESKYWDELSECADKFNNLDNCILEIKHQDNCPPWLETLIKDQKLEETCFSKYIWSVGQIMKQTLKLVNFKR